MVEGGRNANVKVGLYDLEAQTQMPKLRQTLILYKWLENPRVRQCLFNSISITPLLTSVYDYMKVALPEWLLSAILSVALAIGPNFTRDWRAFTPEGHLALSFRSKPDVLVLASFLCWPVLADGLCAVCSCPTLQ